MSPYYDKKMEMSIVKHLKKDNNYDKVKMLFGLVAKWSKAAVCKTVIRGFKSHPDLN